MLDNPWYKKASFLTVDHATTLCHNHLNFRLLYFVSIRRNWQCSWVFLWCTTSRHNVPLSWIRKAVKERVSFLTVSKSFQLLLFLVKFSACIYFRVAPHRFLRLCPSVFFSLLPEPVSLTATNLVNSHQQQQLQLSIPLGHNTCSITVSVLYLDNRIQPQNNYPSWKLGFITIDS